MHALFDKKRRGEIRLALQNGQPMPRHEVAGNPAFFQAKELDEGMRTAIRGDKDSGKAADIAQYRRNQGLIKAVLGRNVVAAEAAMARGADVNARRFPMNGTVFLSAGEDEESHIRETTKTMGDTALMIAVQNNDLVMVTLLVGSNADVNARVNYGTYPTPTALSYAENLGFVEIAQYLRRHGAAL